MSRIRPFALLFLLLASCGGDGCREKAPPDPFADPEYFRHEKAERAQFWN